MVAKFRNYKTLTQAELSLFLFNIYYRCMFKIQNIKIVSNESHVRREFRGDRYVVYSKFTTQEEFDNLKKKIKELRAKKK